MATIIKRGDSYRVQVRRQGQPSLSKSFSTAAAAKAWAKKAALAPQEPRQPSISLAQGLKRYLEGGGAAEEGGICLSAIGSTSGFVTLSPSDR